PWTGWAAWLLCARRCRHTARPTAADREHPARPTAVPRVRGRNRRGGVPEPRSNWGGSPHFVRTKATGDGRGSKGHASCLAAAGSARPPNVRSELEAVPQVGPGRSSGPPYCSPRPELRLL